jgi:hypothetical protein
VREWRPTSIIAGQARFAYLTSALLLAEIYVPFLVGTEARNASSAHDK